MIVAKNDWHCYEGLVMQEVSIRASILGMTDISGTITAADTAQDIAAENEGRVGFWIQNLGNSTLYFDFFQDATAGASSFRLDPGALYETPASGCPIGRISVICSQQDMVFAAREF